MKDGVGRRDVGKGLLAAAAALAMPQASEAQRDRTDYSGLLMANSGTEESRRKLVVQVIDKIRTSIENQTDRSVVQGYLHQADYKFSDDISIGVAFEVRDNKLSALRFIFTKELGGAIGEIEIEASIPQIGNVAEVRNGPVPGRNRPAHAKFGDLEIDLHAPENRELLLRFYNGILTFLVSQA